MKVTAAAACLGLMLGLARGFLAPSQVRPSRVVPTASSPVHMSAAANGENDEKVLNKWSR